MNADHRDHKITDLTQAIATHVAPGSSIFFAGMQHGEPCEAIREIVRQRIGGLTVVPALTQMVSLLVGEGLVDRLVHAYTTDLFEKKGYAFRRARAAGRYPAIVELSHYGLSLALLAGQMGVPFLPTRTHLGSDLMTYAPDQVRQFACPFSGEKLAGIAALRPDVAIAHVQYADRFGNARKDGSMGVDRMGLHAAKRVIITTERIVDPGFIQAEPDRTLIPGFLVDAVVEVPWGAHPLHLRGFYRSDLARFRAAIGHEEGYEAYLRDWVHGPADPLGLEARIARIEGPEFLQSLKP